MITLKECSKITVQLFQKFLYREKGNSKTDRKKITNFSWQLFPLLNRNFEVRKQEESLELASLLDRILKLNFRVQRNRDGMLRENFFLSYYPHSSAHPSRRVGNFESSKSSDGGLPMCRLWYESCQDTAYFLFY